MRIGIISHFRYPITEPFSGGLEMHTHMLARLLMARGHEVVLFASEQSDPALPVEPVCPETALLDVGTSEAFDVSFFREHHAYLSLMTRLRQDVFGTFDVIHNNALHYLPVCLSDTLTTPMVTSLHTPPFCWLESGVRIGEHSRNHFVAVSQTVADAWQGIAPVEVVISNGIDLSRFTFQPVASAEPYFVWYGRIVPEKGLDMAIDAARLMGAKLKIAGPVMDEVYYQTEIVPRLGKDAEYVGHLDHNRLSQLVGGACAFLCTPRWEEPYGLVVAEALACGTPVAAFDRGAMSEILDASCGVLARPDDARDLARAAAKAARLSRKACRKRAEKACNAQTMITAYEALYERLACAARQASVPVLRTVA